MKPGFFHILSRSISFEKRSFIQLALVIMVLAAVITGSLLTGDSVRNSLRSSSFQKLGNTGILISSGLRYFDPSVAGRLKEKTGAKTAGLLEITGSCQNFASGQSAQAVTILAVDKDFFRFHGIDTFVVGKGEVAINGKLAAYLDLKPRDDIIIHFSPISAVPLNAPFSPGQSEAESIALKVGSILSPLQSGNFSLAISQIDPMNIFVNRSDLSDTKEAIPWINKILLDKASSMSLLKVNQILKEVLVPEDIGLNLNYIKKSKSYELISDRIFLDQLLIDSVRKAFPASWPVITYLGNSFRLRNKSTPYSFISALPSELYPGVPSGNEIIINQWLADDLGAFKGDTLKVSWYSADALNNLVEKDTVFIVSDIQPNNGPLADSLLMPLFPGIAGRETCSGWDAGKYVNTELIRKKDEDYWNRYRGTPKAFISYETGRRLWGNNFGPATALRFGHNATEKQIRSALRGKLDPGITGFVVTNIRDESKKAASSGVDFSTLFLSLGFFMIISSVLLLVLVLASYFESKRKEVSTLFALGFSKGWIEKLILSESVFMAFSGALAGAFAGWLFNLVIIRALNSVWLGAVQTRTLVPHFRMMTIGAGLMITVAIVVVVLKIKSGRFLKNFYIKKSRETKKASGRINLILVLITSLLAVTMGFLSVLIKSQSVIFSFLAGVLLFAFLILLWRQHYIGAVTKETGQIRTYNQLTARFYMFSSSQIVTPVIFIAAGLFAVVITGVNRLSITDASLGRKGGTGGFVIWGETGVPVKEDLNSSLVRRDLGIDDQDLAGLKFVQCLKSPGNDASCLNLNHITAPPLLGIPASALVLRNAFSFAGYNKKHSVDNPWKLLDYPPEANTIYGIADQTVLEYGLKMKVGDTLKIRSETGQLLNIVIAAGLRSSVFQGYMLIGRGNLSRYYPSVPGSQVFLADGDSKKLEIYKNVLNDRLSLYTPHFESAADRLASFFVVTNTYLSVFTVLGGIGMILGIIGLGIILLRNLSQRKQEYAIMMATGFPISDIRSMILRDQVKILLMGIFTGLISALVATLPSLSLSSGLPWKTLSVMILTLVVVGLSSLVAALRSITGDYLISSIRKN